MNELYLLEYIQALENLDREARGKEVLKRLYDIGITPEIQKNRFLNITNYIVDFSRQMHKQKYILFCGHYDAVKGSPGANDNASSIAVLLGLCSKLKDRQVPVKVIFFDREEAFFRTPFIKLGLLGSLYYVIRNKLSDIEAVFNLEFCGLGDSLAIWPVKEEQQLTAVKVSCEAAKSLGMSFQKVHVPMLLLSSDHQSFRFKGIDNSITLTLLPEEQLPLLQKFIKDVQITELLRGRRPVMPGILDTIHKGYDNSSQLQESSLQLMLSLLLNIISLSDFRKHD